METIIGRELIDRNGHIFNTSHVLAKVTALYFSASYCPPCKKFTPILAEKYDEINELTREGLEIILIPSDKTVEVYQDYFKDQPWLSILYEGDLKQTLREKYNVKTIPTLIFFNELGNIIEREGRLLVQNNTAKEIINRLFS